MERGAARAAAVSCVVLVGASAADAGAQPCCTATSSNEVAVVGRCYQAALVGQLSYEHAWGSHAADGGYRPLADAEIDDLVFTLGGGFRPGWRRLQIQGSIPWRMQHRSLGSLPAETAFRPGDATAGLRLTATEDSLSTVDFSEPGTLVPFVDLLAAIGLPTGVAPEDSHVPGAADVTSDGTWKLGGGLKVSKFLSSSHVVLLRGVYTHVFPRTVPGAAGTEREIALGDDIDANLSFLYLHNLWWSLGGFGDLRYRLPSQQDGVEVPASASHRLRLGSWVSYHLTYPTWLLTVALSSDLPLDRVAANIPYAGSNLSLTLQRNFPY